MVSRTTSGEPFAVAQRMTVRDEVARDTALFTLVPLIVLIPILLFIVHHVLRRGFAPMTAMSRQVDRLEGGQLTMLEEGRVPLEALPLVQAFNRMLVRLGLVLEQRRRFVSDAAHELRTPVAALMVQADNVQHASLSEEAATRVRVLRQGLVRMSALIDQLLDFARVQGATATTAQRLPLDEMVRTAIEEILPLAHARRIDLGCLQLDPAQITGDPVHARALLRNAIGNAVRYTPEGGSVDVSVVGSGADVSVVVEDTGPGIRAADVERVFGPFVRLLGHQEPGSGLGLAIADAAARALGGRIQLEQRVDGRSGLRFVYRQPRSCRGSS
jgi:two-component system OmpR family sensor kinase